MSTHEGEIIGEWRKTHKEEFHISYQFPVKERHFSLLPCPENIWYSLFKVHGELLLWKQSSNSVKPTSHFHLALRNMELYFHVRIHLHSGTLMHRVNLDFTVYC